MASLASSISFACFLAFASVFFFTFLGSLRRISKSTDFITYLACSLTMDTLIFSGGMVSGCGVLYSPGLTFLKTEKLTTTADREARTEREYNNKTIEVGSKERAKKSAVGGH